MTIWPQYSPTPVPPICTSSLISAEPPRAVAATAPSETAMLSSPSSADPSALPAAAVHSVTVQSSRSCGSSCCRAPAAEDGSSAPPTPSGEQASGRARGLGHGRGTMRGPPASNASPVQTRTAAAAAKEPTMWRIDCSFAASSLASSFLRIAASVHARSELHCCGRQVAFLLVICRQQDDTWATHLLI